MAGRNAQIPWQPMEQASGRRRTKDTLPCPTRDSLPMGFHLRVCLHENVRPHRDRFRSSRLVPLHTVTGKSNYSPSRQMDHTLPNLLGHSFYLLAGPSSNLYRLGDHLVLFRLIMTKQTSS